MGNLLAFMLALFELLFELLDVRDAAGPNRHQLMPTATQFHDDDSYSKGQCTERDNCAQAERDAYGHNDRLDRGPAQRVLRVLEDRHEHGRIASNVEPL
jgi:hypothetical protein